MQTKGAVKWIKTLVLAGLGGGFVAGISAAMDPVKYSFPADLGSGKLWKYVVAGAALTMGALLVRSPLGQKAMQELKESQAQLAEDREALEKIKTELKPKTDDQDKDKKP